MLEDKTKTSSAKTKTKTTEFWSRAVNVSTEVVHSCVSPVRCVSTVSKCPLFTFNHTPCHAAINASTEVAHSCVSPVRCVSTVSKCPLFAFNHTPCHAAFVISNEKKLYTDVTSDNEF